MRKKARGIELELVFAYETASPQLSASLRNFYLVFIAIYFNPKLFLSLLSALAGSMPVESANKLNKELEPTRIMLRLLRVFFKLTFLPSAMYCGLSTRIF